MSPDSVQDQAKRGTASEMFRPTRRRFFCSLASGRAPGAAATAASDR